MEKRKYDHESIKFCYQKAYLDPTDLWQGMLNYSNDVVRRRDSQKRPIEGDKRLDFYRFITKKHPFKMLQACRGSWKSSICCADYGTWRIAREFFLTGESNLRILVASESLKLAERNLRWQKIIMEWRPRFIELFGDHRPKEKGGYLWGNKGLTSRFRIDPRLIENTITPFGLESASSGFHYDLIICDDLQAERTTTTKDQIEKCYDYYRLLHSILDPHGEMIILCTRWHELDVYQKIEDENQYAGAKEKFKILRVPATNDETGKLNFPNILDEKKLNDLRRKQGPFIFSCQYDLKPVPDERKTIKSQWIRFVTPQHYRQKHLNVYTSADFAWTEVRKGDFRRSSMPDFTVILTVAVDEQWNYIFLDAFRARCSKSEAVSELYRQWETHQAKTVVLQKYDQRGVKEMIEQYGHIEGKYMFVEWIAYPPGQGKVTRIENLLQPAFAAKKVFLLPNMQWFIDEELLDLPKPKYDDAMDALCNIIRISKPALKTTVDLELEAQQRRIRMLKAGLNPYEEREDCVH
jgi:predicted phage terminase large subunit-like protein